MKNKFKSTVRRGLVVTVVALSLASLNSFALSSATPTNLATSATGTMGPTNKVAAATILKATPATTSSIMTEDIRDIRGPKHITSPWLWPLWFAGGVALAGLLYSAWLWNRRRTTAALLPYEIALARLDAARAADCPPIKLLGLAQQYFGALAFTGVCHCSRHNF